VDVVQCHNVLYLVTLVPSGTGWTKYRKYLKHCTRSKSKEHVETCLEAMAQCQTVTFYESVFFFLQRPSKHPAYGPNGP